METMQELIPFAREMLSQKPSRGMVKVYLLGSLFAVLGTVVGLMETVCQPFCTSSAGEPMDAEVEALVARERRRLAALQRHSSSSAGFHEVEQASCLEAEMVAAKAKTRGHVQRNAANRLYAS